MDLTVALRLRAYTEGLSEMKALREETSEVAAALKEVREAARAGGQVSPGSIKALGGFQQFREEFEKAQKALSAPRDVVPAEAEKAFRARVRITNGLAKVRLAESVRLEHEETTAIVREEKARQRQFNETDGLRRKLWLDEVRAVRAATAEIDAAVARGEEEQRQAMKATLDYNMRYWAQRGRAAREGEAAEVRAATAAARRHRETLRGLGLGIFAGPAAEGEEGHGGVAGGRHGRGFLGELGTAAEYTLVYGAINKLLQGVGALARSPFSLGRMTLGVADEARQIQESAAAIGLSARTYQELRFAFAGKGISEDRVQPTVQIAERSAVAAIRGIKGQTVAFKALGISVRQLKDDTRDPMKLLTDISNAISKIKNPGKKIAIADLIFGRNGSQYLPLLDKGYLAHAATAADKSGAILSDRDVDAGDRVASQWKQLGLQAQGIKNEVAAAAFPIISQLIGDASGWITKNRAEVSSIIQTDMAELKADLPIIEKGLVGIANGALEIAKDFAPFLHQIVQFSSSPFGRYFFSNQIIPGLDPAHPAGDAKIASLIDPQHRHFTGGPNGTVVPPPEVHVHVHPAPGVSVGRTTSRGAQVTVHRGQLQAGG